MTASTQGSMTGEATTSSKRQNGSRATAAEGRESISAFVICFNEEDYILDCLQSLEFCDEVVVVDSFSSDRTVELATQWGARVIQRKWTGFRDQKAFGLENVHHDWVLNLDADERVSAELQQSILDVLKRDYAARQHGAPIPVAGFMLNRVVFFLGRWWRRGGWYPEYRLRLVRKSLTTWGGQDPHERPEVAGRTETLGGELFHYTYESVDEQFRRLNEFSSIAALQGFRGGRRVGVLALTLNPLVRFLKFYLLKRGFLEGAAGFVVALNEACYTYMKYAKLWGHWEAKRIAMRKGKTS